MNLLKLSRELVIRKLLFAWMLFSSGAFLYAQELKNDTIQDVIERAQNGGNDGATSIFASATWNSTNRTLVPNDGLFGKPLGYRADETKLNVWSFTLGFRSQLHKNIAWEGAVSYMRNGESYSFEDTDTSYMYESRYSYIAVPMKLFYTYGSDIKLLVGAGIVPQMFTGFKQDIEYEGEKNATIKEEVKTRIGYNSFVLSTVFNVGAQFKVGDRWSVLILPEYKLQLTSSLEKNAAYKHKASTFGGHIGLVFDL
jgi:hypothetical protein